LKEQRACGLSTFDKDVRDGLEVTGKMNCEKCQELLSDFLDGVLSDDDHRTLSAHLEECLSCYGVQRELDSIISYCRDHRGEYEAPPNERALWLRIHNTLENEPRARAFASGSSTSTQSLGWLSSLWNRQWELSFAQMATGVVAIAVAVSLITVLGIRNTSSGGDDASIASRESNMPATLASYPGSIDDRMKQQQQKIDYWNRRIEQRKAQWNAQMRDAFERNLQALDQAVYAHREELRQNPHDEVSQEMLNSALNEKMDLLREFSDL
jgi:hypothetical protein